ncbi:MAG: helix-turn-helix domain-containing protein [Pseudomonadota bacterium]
MDIARACDAFSALSQPTRLSVFRLLLQVGPDGLPAGEIASCCGAKQNTMSVNLSVLARAGLIRSVRDGRSIRYFADQDGLKGLLAFLMEDCCGGRAEECAAIIGDLALVKRLKDTP